jgi:hypothetical protein
MKVVQGAKFICENAAGKLPRHAMARRAKQLGQTEKPANY